jgi:DNA-directed RNA polymerase specialized sigma24 family protein
LKACLRSATVSARLARRVAGVYDQYWMDRPEDHGVPQHVADRVRRHAASQGFHGPLTWDDDTIDDPKAEPQMDAAEPVAVEGENLADRWLMGESVILSTTADRDKALIHLFEWTTLTPAQIAERLEMAEAAAEQVWFRHRWKCRAEGRPVPWRRRWELRDKNLTKNDLEEVA